MAKALIGPPPSAIINLPVLDECRFLVDAGAIVAEEISATHSAYVEPEWWNLEARVVWLIEFLKRMEQLDRKQTGKTQA
ncbi:MAG: hypothetical protein ING33_10150 [Rhodocyclaceae bacterium]|nr:hypothetical protein [Rhodocyclaceae bacterium]